MGMPQPAGMVPPCAPNNAANRRLGASWWRLAIALVAVSLVPTAQATTVIPPEFPALVSDSDYIVHATVKSVHCEKRPSARGVKIVTLVELEVVDTVVGTSPAALTLQLLGGRVGDEQVRVEGMPQFHVGDEDVLFVQGNGRTICPLPGMMHGRYPVQRDAATGRRYMLRADGAPLLTTTEISTPLLSHDAAGRSAAGIRGLELTSFIAQIRTAAQANAHPNRTR